MGIIIIIICSFFLLPHNTYSSSKEDYELQERCGKRSEERFKKEYGDGNIFIGKHLEVFTYKCHYNKKLNKCFFLLSGNPSSPGSNSFTRTLLNINENNEYGLIVKSKNSENPVVCWVLEKGCNSEKEWYTLVKPYMEE